MFQREYPRGPTIVRYLNKRSTLIDDKKVYEVVFDEKWVTLGLEDTSTGDTEFQRYKLPREMLPLEEFMDELLKIIADEGIDVVVGPESAL